MLRCSCPAKCPVQRIILGPARHTVQAVGGSSKKLDAVICPLMSLNVLNHRSGTNSVESKCSGLRFRVEVDTGKLDANVSRHTAGIHGIATAILGTCFRYYTLCKSCSTRYRCITQNNQTCPAAGKTITDRGSISQQYWQFPTPVRNNFCAFSMTSTAFCSLARIRVPGWIVSVVSELTKT